MTLTDSQYKYTPVSGLGNGEPNYIPQPDSINRVKARVVAVKHAFIKSQSFPTETKILFQLREGENIPQKPWIKKVRVSYYVPYEPLSPYYLLKKGDIVELLFDGQGDFIASRFPPYIYDWLPQEYLMGSEELRTSQ